MTDPHDAAVLALVALATAADDRRLDACVAAWGAVVEVDRDTLAHASGTMVRYLAGQVAEHEGCTAADVLSQIAAHASAEP